ncbi:MAG: manganese catalase family protein [Lachnospiraceae bacterium]|nr:manganese catalase family protein [Lachnospiraceae bacterium]
MWIYEKKLEFPVKITKPDANMAKIILDAYGGGDGEIGAALRYLSQRYTMVTPQAKATLNDIGTEELAHLEIVGSMFEQLTNGLTDKEIEASSLKPYYVSHGLGVYPAGASGDAFTASALQSKGNPITDLYEDMSAEQKAKAMYEYLINMATDQSVIKVLNFLREREIVHFQRFGEALDIVKSSLNGERVFFMEKPDFMKSE